MLKKTITYTDYNGVTRTEDFYFNLNKAELFQMEFGTEGTFTNVIKKIAQTKDVPTMVSLMKDVILKSYGEKSPDGRRFIKSEELSNNFSQTEAFSELYLELALDDQKASEFLNGLMPADLAKKASSLSNEEKANLLGVSVEEIADTGNANDSH